MKMSATIDLLAAALCKAQATLGHASKDGANPHFRSAYATLQSVVETIREPFASNGLSFLQPLSIEEGTGRVVVETVVLHSSGQWISGEVSATPAKNDPQGVGSLISYLKRYSLQAMVGIASADDDDGEAAMGRGDSGRGGAQSPPPAAKYGGRK